MSQVTETLVEEFDHYHEQGLHAPMTINEEMQLVFAWRKQNNCAPIDAAIAAIATQKGGAK